MQNDDITPSLDVIKDELFALTELPEPARQQHLEALYGTNPALARAVAGLLPDAFATQTAAMAAPARWLDEISQARTPDRLGPWRVLRELGRGGMGLVLLAERADGAYDQQVALKVLPPAWAGADGGARLRAEAQALARLKHPHVARLVDAGFDQGCAYLVMDYVDGEPITTHARQRALPLAARLRLLLQLCSAVQFAHGQLLVHRDLKPDNVLVDSSGQVKLLDFGIAKVLAAGPGASDMQNTLSLQQACTPAYASPEQLLGAPVTVATDVFSLGVLLYELLAGQRPFLPAGGDTLAQVRAVLEGRPDTAALRRLQVPADLQAVVLKALEKPVERRYASVEALANDLQAFLQGLPVSAQAPSWGYRSAKFLRRHALAASATALAAVAGLSLTAWALLNAQAAREQQQLAQQRLEAVRAIANKVVFDYNRALEPIPGTLEVRKTLVADALSYLNALAQDARGDAVLLADIATGFEAIGDVQGRGATGGNLGDLPGARQSYEQALQIRQAACPATAEASASASPGAAASPAACVALARTLVRLGDNAFTQGQVAQAIPRFDQALLATASALASPALDASLQAQAQDARFDAAQRLAGLSTRQTGAAYARGLALAQAQLEAAQALVRVAPSTKSNENLRVAQDFMAFRSLAEGQADIARDHALAAVAGARALQQARPGRDSQVALATSLARLAEIQAHRLAPGEARPAIDEAFAIALALHEAEPEDRHLRARLANIGRRVGQVNNLLGDPAALQANLRDLPRVLQVSGVFTPADGVFHAQHLSVLQELAETQLRLGQPAEALRSLAYLPPQLPPNPRAAADQAEAFLLRAQARRATGDAAAALQDFQAAHRTLTAQVRETPTTPAAPRKLWAEAWGASWARAQPQQAVVLASLDQELANGVQTLQEARRLTPWWQRQLQQAQAR